MSNFYSRRGGCRYGRRDIERLETDPRLYDIPKLKDIAGGLSDYGRTVEGATQALIRALDDDDGQGVEDAVEEIYEISVNLEADYKDLRRAIDMY